MGELKYFVLLSFTLWSFAVTDSQDNGFRELLQARNDQDEIQRGNDFEDQIESLQSGESFFIRSSSVMLSRTLILNSNNITIRGRGRNRTTVHCPQEGERSALMIRGQNVTIEALTVTGCMTRTAIVVDGRRRSRSEGVSASFYEVRFSQNGRTNSSIMGAGLRISACLNDTCARPEVNVTSCSFEGNTALTGGAIFGQNCDLRISDSTFVDNQAYLAAGAVYINDGQPNLEINSSVFTGNSATWHNQGNNRTWSELRAAASGIRERGGGAIFVGTPSRVTINHSNFTGNNICASGGGIYIESHNANRTLAVYIHIRLHNCIFTSNHVSCEGPLRAAQNDSLGPTLNFGGAVALLSRQNVILDVLLSNSEFRENTALNGGAVFLQAPSEVIHNLSSCVFSDNHVDLVGGAILLRRSHLVINGSTFERNAGRFGGAVGLYDDARVIIGPHIVDGTPTIFANNSALYGGGVWAALRVSVHCEGAHFINNTAVRRGGGINIEQTAQQNSVYGGVFEDNLSMVGGGISLINVAIFTLQAFNGERVKISNNTAFVGGGFYSAPGVFLLIQLTLQEADFIDNEVFRLSDERMEAISYRFAQDPTVHELITGSGVIRPRNFTLQELFMELSEMPDGQGGGFAITLGDLTMYVIAEVLFKDLKIRGNKAYVGGGGSLYTSESYWNLQDRPSCIPAIFGFHLCQKLLFQNVTIIDNKAEYAGGLFAAKPETIMLTCDHNVLGENRTLVEVMKPRLQAQYPSMNFKEDLLCTDIHSNLISDGGPFEGADVGSAAASLHLENSNGTLKTVASGDRLSMPCEDQRDSEPCSRDLTVVVKDAFNQTISRGIEDSNLDLTLSAKNVTGDLRYTASSGRVTINSTSAWGISVSFATLKIQVTSNSSMEVTANFSTRACVIGEHVLDTVCSRCPPDQYSFNTSDSSCQSCDSHAICSGGAALVPVNGYWHSTPFSPQFHPCLFSGACTYDNRTENLTHFYNNTGRLQEQLNKLELFLSEGGEQPTFSAYEQCAEGYESVLCGSCASGYGRSINGECSKCPKKGRSVGLGLLSFASLLVLIGVNAVITVVSAETRIELRQLELRDQDTSKNEAPGVPSSARENGASFRPGTSQARSATLSNTCNETEEEQKTKHRLISTVVLSETFKILLNYLQITSAALRLQVTWNAPMNGLLSVEAFAVGIASNTFSAPTECLLESTSVENPSIAALWIRLLKPTAGLLFLITVFSIVWLTVKTKRSARKSPGQRDTLKTSWTTGAIIITLVAIYFSYIDVARDFLRTVNCIDVDVSEDMISNHPYKQYAIARGNDIWVEDTKLRCFQGAHRLTGILGIGGLILSLLVIVFIVVWPRMNKRHEADPVFIARYSFMYQGYRSDWYTRCWEAVILIRKALKAAVIVFGVRLGPNLQATMCVGILVLALILQAVIRPFRVTNLQIVPEYSGRLFSFCGLPAVAEKWRQINNGVCLNVLESFSLFCSTTVFFTAVVLNDSNASRSGERAIIVFSFVLNISFVFYMIFRLYAAFHIVADLKLEASKTPNVAARTNRVGVVGLFEKGRSVLRIMYGTYKESESSLQRGSSYGMIECTDVQTNNPSTPSEITTEP